MEPPAAKRPKLQGDAAAVPSTLPLLRCGVSEDKGARTSMEDVAVCLLQAENDPDSSLRVSFFAVFDGHGGRQCAQYAADHLHTKIMAAGLVPDQVASGQQQLDIRAAKQAIIQGCKSLDHELLQLCQKNHWPDGAAAVAVWVVGDVVLVANVGDAKCVLARAVEQAPTPPPLAATPPPPLPATITPPPPPLKAITLTREHLAIYPGERSRIEKAGGQVTKDGRLNGRIQISRSFGDAAYKGCGATAVPDIAAFRLKPQDQFLLCGCDGFWGVFDPQGAVNCAAAAMAAGKEGKAVTNKLLYEAVRERRCKDNCTVLLVQLVSSDAAPPPAAAGGPDAGGADGQSGQQDTAQHSGNATVGTQSGAPAAAAGAAEETVAAAADAGASAGAGGPPLSGAATHHAVNQPQGLQQGQGQQRDQEQGQEHEQGQEQEQ